MAKKLLIRDLTLRDGQQSQFATRMTQKQVDRVLPMFASAGFYAMEVWGGAVPDSIMRYLAEDPWERLESIKAGIGTRSKLTALSRGRNLFGYNPYPDSIVEGFNRNAIKSGIDIMRIFDALNDIENMKHTIEVVHKNGGLADCAVCYTVDPKFPPHLKPGDTFEGRKIPPKIFTVDYFVEKAVRLEQLGADMVSIKDMAGLVDTESAAHVISALKRKLKVPVDFHTHCTPGFGLSSVLCALLNGADIIDTVIWSFSGGPAAPAFELICIFAQKLGFDIDIDLKAVARIERELRKMRVELAAFDTEKMLPIEFDISNYTLSYEIDKMFADAIAAAEKNDFDTTTTLCQAIEKHFNFPPPNDKVRLAQIPGGMYTNMVAQLEAAKMGHLFDEVLEHVPTVRLDAGLPPLVTPTSQIVGVQAVAYVVDVAQGKAPYTTVSNQFYNLVQGGYGKTPYPVDPVFRKKITGSAEEKPFTPKDHAFAENPFLPELGEGVRLAETEKEELLLELFPAVAKPFLEKRKKDLYAPVVANRKKLKREFDEYEFAVLLSALEDNPTALPESTLQ